MTFCYCALPDIEGFQQGYDFFQVRDGVAVRRPRGPKRGGRRFSARDALLHLRDLSPLPGRAVKSFFVLWGWRAGSATRAVG